LLFKPGDGKRVAKFIDNMRRAVNGNEALFDLRSFDLVFIPIHECGHYYLVVFELKYPGIWVIDNLNDFVPLLKLKDSDDYFQKEASYKVVRQ
jgi:Ulp1 family protease